MPGNGAKSQPRCSPRFDTAQRIPTPRSRRAIPRRCGYTWALSDDLHLLILSQCSLEELAKAALVSPAWRQLIATADHLWAELARRMWVGRHVSQVCRNQPAISGRRVRPRPVVRCAATS